MLITLAFLLIVVFPRLFLRRETVTPFNEAARILGLAFILFGYLLRVSARGFKADYSRSGHTLIQDGPYAVSRNPMYLGIICIGLGIAAALFNWWVIILFPVVFIIRYLRLMLKEEKMLYKAFPKDYPAYCKRVPRLLPAASAIFKKDIGEYLPIKLEWIKKERWSIIPLFLAIALLEGWKRIRYQCPLASLDEAMMVALTIMLFIGIGLYLYKRTDRIKRHDSNKSKTN